MARSLWKFINFSRRKAAYCGFSGKGTSLHGLYLSKSILLERELLIRYAHSPDLIKLLENSPPSGPSAKTGLCSLPDEILLMIVEEFVVPGVDTICLAITCKKLLALSMKALHDLRTAEYAPWAHCRMACILNHADYKNAPDSLVPPALKEEIRAALKDDGVPGHFAGTAALNYAPHSLSEPLRLHVKHPYSQVFLPLPDGDRQLFLATTATSLPTRDEWVLCNTVKREYVRAQPLSTQIGAQDDGLPFLEDYSIDRVQALITRISWPSSPGLFGISDFVKDSRSGSWAGDRFCITSIEKEVAGDPEYKDVTGEVFEDIMAIDRNINVHELY
ncbi:hypothetical protein FKP32DRAFT_1673984 [Trametes sanguinea]|nr:hypothetical protein FKP32DRAFT_1673984 [Trametes sanguinea]